MPSRSSHSTMLSHLATCSHWAEKDSAPTNLLAKCSCTNLGHRPDSSSHSPASFLSPPSSIAVFPALHCVGPLLAKCWPRRILALCHNARAPSIRPGLARCGEGQSMLQIRMHLLTLRYVLGAPVASLRGAARPLRAALAAKPRHPPCERSTQRRSARPACSGDATRPTCTPWRAPCPCSR